MASIRRRGERYQVQVRRRGLPLQSRTFLNLKDAQAWARHMEVLADRHDLPHDPRVLQRMTLGELVTRYRDTISPKKRSGEIEHIVLSAFLQHSICRKPITEVTSAIFAAYRDERLNEVKPATLKRQLSPIRHMFEVARHEWGLPIKENPLAKLRWKGVDQRRERRLRPGELERLTEAAKRCRNSLVDLIIRLAVETGMRRSEILNIRRNDVDAPNRSLLIPETKTGHSRMIPLTTLASLLLSQAAKGLHEQDRLFPITPNAFRLAWERLKRRAGIQDLHFHDLRHEAVSRLFEKGLTVPEVALISGHRDIRMLSRYSHAQRQLIHAKFDAAEM
jgi:integrase